MISVAENSNKFQKTRFWTEKSVEDVITLGPMAQATLVYIEMDETAGLSLLECTIIYIVLSAFCITKAYVRD
jgi:hypothetical protein